MDIFKNNDSSGYGYEPAGYDPGQTSRALEYTIPANLKEKLAPYSIFLQKLAGNLVQSSIVNQEILEKMMTRLAVVEDVQTMSVKELMYDDNYEENLWPYLRDDYTRAKNAAKGQGGKWFDFDDPRQNKDVDLLTRTITSVLQTVDKIKRSR